jgi:hypothetical protein
MDRDDIQKCGEHVREALGIMERAADSQPEVHVLLCLRELMEDIAWLESHGGVSANVVRLSDVKHLRGIEVRAAD